MQINEGFRQQSSQPLQLSNERRIREQQKSSFIEILTEPNEKQTEDLIQQIATLLEEQAFIQSSGESTREYRTRVNTVKMRIKGNRGIFIRKALFTGILSPAELMALDMNKLNEESVQQYLKSVGRDWNNKAVSESTNSYVAPVLVIQQRNVIVTPIVPPPIAQVVAFPPPIQNNQNPFSEPQLFQIIEQPLPDESKNFEQEIEQNFTQEMIQAEHNIDFVEGDEYTWIQLQKETSNAEENHLSPLPSSNIINQDFIESESPPLKEMSVERVLTQEIQEQERSYYKVFETVEKDTKYEDEKASMLSELSESEENQKKGINLEKQLDDQDAYEQQLQEQQYQENLQDDKILYQHEQDQGQQQDQGYEQEQEYYQQEQEQFYSDQQQEYQQQQPDNQQLDQQYFMQEHGQYYQKNHYQMDGQNNAESNQYQQPVENNLVNEQITKLELENAILKENSRNQLEQSQQNEKLLQQQIEMLKQSNANIHYSNISKQIGELIGQNQKLFSEMTDLKEKLNQSADNVLNQIQNHTKQTQKEFQTLNDMVKNLSLDSLNQTKTIQQFAQRSDEKQSTGQKLIVEKVNQLTIAPQFQRKTQPILEQPNELWSESQELLNQKTQEILTQRPQEILTQKPQEIITEKYVNVLSTGQKQSTETMVNQATINKPEPITIHNQPHTIPRPSRPTKREQRSQVPGSLFD